MDSNLETSLATILETKLETKLENTLATVPLTPSSSLDPHTLHPDP